MTDIPMKQLISAEEIQSAVGKLGLQLAADYQGCPLTVLGVLTGSIVFLADLIRTIEMPLNVGLLQASSYHGRSTTSGELTINADLLPEIAGRDVLLVDDILDTGKTMQSLVETLQGHSPKSVRSAALLWKEERTVTDIQPDYHCFKIPNEFVVGYGMDFDGQYRHLPAVSALDDAELKPLS